MIQRVFHFLKRDAGARKYFLNTSLLLGARGVQMVLALVVGAMVARYMGPADYGIYNYVISYVGIFMALSTLGIGTIVVKDLLKKTYTEEIILGSGLILRLMGSTVVVLLILLITFITGEKENVRWFLFIASIQPVIKSFEVMMHYFEAKVISKYTVAAQLTSLFIISAAKVIVIIGDYPLDWFYYLLVIDSSIIVLIMIIEYRTLRGNILNWRFQRAYAKELLKQSWPLIFSGVLVTIYLKIDQVIIRHMMDETSVGLYAAAVKLSEAWVSIPWLISSSLYPALVNSHMENKLLFQSRVEQAYVLLISIAIAIFLPILLFAGTITHLIYGEQYAASAAALQYHIGSMLFIFMGSVANRWLIIENIQKYWMINSAIGAVTNIILNILLIPTMGINGSALATLLSYALAYHFAYAFVKPTRMVFYEQNRSMLRVLLIIPAVRMIRKVKSR